MSMEQAKLFIERMMKDEAFRTRIMAVDDVAERMQLVKAEGFDCASEEIKTMFEELSDAAVEGAAGGYRIDEGTIVSSITGKICPGGGQCGAVLYWR